MTPVRRYRYPWRAGNRAELLIDGDAFFPAMLRAIEGASEYVLLELYLVSSGLIAAQFIEALAAAAKRGVHVYLLLDGFGASRLTHSDRERLRAAGVHLAFFNPVRLDFALRNLERDHRKVLVTDGRVAFAGGAGLSDEFAAGQHARPWRDTMVRITGPVVSDWRDLFARVWRRNAGQPPRLPEAAAPGTPGTASGRVTIASGLRVQEVKRSLIKHMRAARRRLWFATPYFLPSRKIRRALRRAAKRGADVRVLLPGPVTDNRPVRHAGRRFYSRLLRNGVRIFEYDARFMHAKTYLCDDWVSIGSSNADRWNLRWNLEANQEVIDPAFAGEVAAMLEADFASSREISYDEWLRRPWYGRFQEWFWGSVELWVDRVTRRKP